MVEKRDKRQRVEGILQQRLNYRVALHNGKGPDVLRNRRRPDCPRRLDGHKTGEEPAGAIE